MSEQPSIPACSVVIPVFNSETTVSKTIDRTVRFFEERGLSYELILVNDGSTDDSWNAIRREATERDHVIAVDLLRNYGQHSANMCGFRMSRGRYVVTMDDDLQNPPEEIEKLLAAADEGYDLVIGRFHQKRHAAYRKLGTVMIGALNRHIFHKPDDLVLTNFRLIRRDVVDRMCGYQTPEPYTPGLALMFSTRRVNVLVEHQPRSEGKSNYNLIRILRLVARILFNYSSFPLRIVAAGGFMVSGASLLLGLFYLIKGLIVGTAVAGWTTLVVLLSFFNGVSTMMLAMLGEYTIRLLNQTRSTESFHIREVARRHD